MKNKITNNLSLILILGAVLSLSFAYDVIAGYLIADPDLVTNLRFNENSGTIATDDSGYNNTGTIYGATYVQGILGTALKFDGVDDYVKLNNNALFNFNIAKEPMTILAWVKPNSESYYVVDKIGGATTTGYRFYVGGGVAGVAFSVGDGASAAGKTQSGGSVTYGKWYFAAVTVEAGKSVKLYLDGKEVSYNHIFTAWSSAGENTAPLLIGANPSYGYYFNGAIDELKIYNRTLTPEEILKEFQSSYSPDKDADNVKDDEDLCLDTPLLEQVYDGCSCSQIRSYDANDELIKTLNKKYPGIYGICEATLKGAKGIGIAGKLTDIIPSLEGLQFASL